MWYGIQDLAGNLLGRRAEGGKLRGKTSGLRFHPSSLLHHFRFQVSSLILPATFSVATNSGR